MANHRFQNLIRFYLILVFNVPLLAHYSMRYFNLITETMENNFYIYNFLYIFHKRILLINSCNKNRFY